MTIYVVILAHLNAPQYNGKFGITHFKIFATTEFTEK